MPGIPSMHSVSTGDLPVSGDWNNDGVTEIGVFRPSTQRFYLDKNGNGHWDAGDSLYAFGLSGDLAGCRRLEQ